jgi:hypothetical protein
MAQVMVGIRGEAHDKLKKLCKRKRVSMQGLLSGLVYMANGDTEMGIIDIDWKALQEAFPNNKNRNKRRWDVVVQSVRTLMEETSDPSEIAMRSRWTIGQCKRAVEEIENERA